MALAELIQKWQDPTEDLRRRKAAALLEFQTGDWSQQLRNFVRLQFAEETFQRLRLNIDSSWNVSSYACNKIGSIYAGKVKRYIDGIDLDETIAGSVYTRSGALDLALATANPLTLGVGNLFVRPIATVDTNGSPVVLLDFVTPDQVVITESATDPNGIAELLYCLGSGENRSYVYWSVDQHATLDRNWQIIPNPNNPNNANPYNVIPFVPFRESWRMKNFFQHKTGSSLQQTTLQAGAALTAFAYRQRAGSFKQPVISGDPGRDFPIDHVLDCVTPLVLGTGGSASTLDLQSNYQALLDTIIKRAGTNLSLHGFTDQALRGTITAQSGIALRVQQTELETAWRKQRRIYSLYERALYAIASIVASVELGIEFPRGALEVEFPDVGPQSSPIDLANVYNPQVDRGLIPKWYACMMINGVSEERARELVAEADAERANTGDLLPLIPADSNLPGAALES